MLPSFKDTKKDMVGETYTRDAFDDVLETVERGDWFDKEDLLRKISDHFSKVEEVKPDDAVRTLKAIGVAARKKVKEKLSVNEVDACFAVLNNVYVEDLPKKAILSFLGKKIRAEKDDVERGDLVGAFGHYMKNVYHHQSDASLLMLAPEFLKICSGLATEESVELRENIVNDIAEILEEHPGKRVTAANWELKKDYFAPAIQSFVDDKDAWIRRKARKSLSDFNTRYQKATFPKLVIQPK